MKPLMERFWAKIKKSDSCWIWTDAPSKGYGRIAIGGGYYAYAHRLSYEFDVGPIPEGMQIDHLCRNRACVNPDHLEAVTQAENIRRGFGVSAICRRQTHCKNGHPFDEKNTRMRHRKNGVTERVCRACKRLERAGKVRPFKSNSFRRVA